MDTGDFGQLEIASASRARRIKRRFQAVITIEDPGMPLSRRVRFHNEPAPPQLVLKFEDLDDEEVGIRTATADQVSSAIEFARAYRSARLLVHCHAGIARSTAIALAILADAAGPGREQEALAEVVRLQPYAVPNLLVVRHADQILARGSRLMDIVSRWDQGRAWNRHRRQTNREAVLAYYDSLPAWRQTDRS